MLAGAHGEDDGGRAGDGVAAREDALAGGLQRVLVHDEAALAVALEARGGAAQQRVRRGADGHDDSVRHDDELTALDGRDAAPAGGVGLAEAHLHALEAHDVLVRVAQDLDGVVQELELDALLLGVVDLLSPGGQLVTAAAVDYEHLVRAHALGAARRVHGHVAAADDGDALGVVLYRRIVVVAIGLHEVDTGEVLVGGVDAEQVLARDIHELGQTGAGADEHGLIAILEQLVERHGAADDAVVDELDALALEVLDLAVDYALGQTELGDAVGQDAAALVQRLEDRDVVALLHEVARAGEAARAGADDSDLVAVGRRHDGAGAGVVGVLHVVVGHEALQTADADRLALDAADAVLLALALLGADTAADGGQSGGSGDDLISGLEIALGDLGNEIRDMYHHGAALHAGLVLAVQAALGLVQSLFLGVAQSDLVKVLVPDVGVLRGHGILLQRHIGHGYSASFLNRLQVSSYLWASKSLYIWFRLTARSQSTL